MCGGMMDVERFNKMYISGAKYKDLKKAFNGISFSTINTYRIRLGLPKREKSFERLDVDETKFKELYHAKDHYYTYSEMATIFGCSEALICKIKQRLKLSDREQKSKLNIDEEKFARMYLNAADYTHEMICDEFQICISTLQKLRKTLGLPDRKQKSIYIESDFIKAYNTGLSNHKLANMFCMERRAVQKRIQELCLPPRKNVSLYENEFREAHANGLSIIELADKFKMSRSQIYVYLRKFRLSYVKKIKTSVVEPLLNPLEPTRSKKKDKVAKPVRPIQPIEEQDIKVPVKNHVTTFAIPLRSLREIEKLRLNQNIRKTEQNYKITHKENGYGALIGKEIDQIVSPFTIK